MRRCLVHPSRGNRSLPDTSWSGATSTVERARANLTSRDPVRCKRCVVINSPWRLRLMKKLRNEVDEEVARNGCVSGAANCRRRQIWVVRPPRTLQGRSRNDMLKVLFTTVSRSFISLAGVVLTTISAILFLSLFAIEEFGERSARRVHRHSRVHHHSQRVRAGPAADSAGHRRCCAVATASARPPASPSRWRRSSTSTCRAPASSWRWWRAHRREHRHRRDRHLQGHRDDGEHRVLRRRLPLGDEPRVHHLQPLVPLAGALHPVPHRVRRELVREVEAVGQLAAGVGDPRPLPAPHPHPGGEPAPGAGHLRAVPPAHALHAASSSRSSPATPRTRPTPRRRRC